MSPPSLYVHVPFCVVKCGYCDFTSYVPKDRAVLDAFLDMLDRELAHAAIPAQPSTVFIGGGTPSYLDPTRFARLFAILAAHVQLRGCAEVTMEANPESLTLEKAELARAAGVNRVSVGVQTFDATRLRFLDRAHGAEQTRAGVAMLRTAGFDNVSLDLMFGLPGQTCDEWESDLGQALALRPDHLSCYNLTFEPGTRLFHERQLGRVRENPLERDRDMFARTRAILAQAGYSAYEISNFAGRGGPCRHNDHYWLQGDYVGVGPSASSHRQGTRWSNLKTVEAWGNSLHRGLPPVADAETLTRPQRLREALWLGMRRTAGVDLVAACTRLGCSLPATVVRVIDTLLVQGLIERADDRVFLTESGLLLADTVGERLLNAG